MHADIVKSSGGVFEITVDGRPAFSKRQIGRFPEDEEVVRTVQQALRP